jgi:hypothetical protein
MVDINYTTFYNFHRLNISEYGQYKTGLTINEIIDFQKIFLMSSDENYIFNDSKFTDWHIFWKMADYIKNNYEKL